MPARLSICIAAAGGCGRDRHDRYRRRGRAAAGRSEVGAGVSRRARDVSSAPSAAGVVAATGGVDRFSALAGPHLVEGSLSVLSAPGRFGLHRFAFFGGSRFEMFLLRKESGEVTLGIIVPFVCLG